MDYSTLKENIKIKLIEEFKNFQDKISGIRLPEAYIIKLGRILFPNGENVFPYNIFTQGEDFDFRIAFYPFLSSLIDSNGLRDGIVLYGKGKYNINDNSMIIFKKELMKWQTNLSIEKLIEKCNNKIIEGISGKEEFKLAKGNQLEEKWCQFKRNSRLLNKPLEIGDYGTIKYGGIEQSIVKDSKDYSCVQPEKACELLRIHWLVSDTFDPSPDDTIYCDTHHINTLSHDNKRKNLLKVSMEQHASIEQFMWDGYKINEYTSLVYKK